MGRKPCCEKVGMKKGRWTAEEDQILSDYIKSNGEGSWRSLPKNADLKRGNITPEEEDLIVKLHSTLGSRKPTVTTVVENAPPPPKRRPGRTSRSAMKPKFIPNPKNHKNPNSLKASKNDIVLPTTTIENGVGEKEDALMGLSSSSLSGAKEPGLRPCGYGDDGYCNPSIDGDVGVLSLNDDIFDSCFQLDEPYAVHVSSCESNSVKNSEPYGGVSVGHKNIESMANDFADCRDFVWREGETLWDEKEDLDSVLSWLLNGEEMESETRQRGPNDFGEPLDLDEEKKMAAWLLS
ncbi:unnamed protein product [Arabidopsis arenosa]|uniref:Uncharacterized protein n=1 Tax=Arabidopsis arenosa TaxID=38785 RepID=A0A8S2ALA0_ARAAE|nr:unnamed protein product [Arabidopsis arenosa]